MYGGPRKRGCYHREIRWTRVVRTQDFVWLLLFSALAYVSTDRNPLEIPLLVALAALQVIEPKIAFFATSSGNVTSILLKLAISYLLIGYTGGLAAAIT